MHGTALGVYHPLGFHGLMPKTLAAATSTGDPTNPTNALIIAVPPAARAQTSCTRQETESKIAYISPPSCLGDGPRPPGHQILNYGQRRFTHHRGCGRICS